MEKTKDGEGSVTLTWWKNGRKHRRGAPAEVRYYKGKITAEFWYKHGWQHRRCGPASIFYDSNGKIQFECWHRYGKLHRRSGPAEICYDNGEPTIKRWYINHEMGSATEPAFIQIKGELTEEDCIVYHDIVLIDEFRTLVKNPIVKQTLKILPVPISNIIWDEYCYQ